MGATEDSDGGCFPGGGIDYVRPWRALPEGSERDGLTSRLALEIAEGHALWGRGAHVLARNDASDDVVAVTADGVFAIVHLTWSEAPQVAPWPWTECYRSGEALARALAAWSRQAGFLEE